jgi:hypothetical protein
MAAIGKFDRKARSETQSLMTPAVIEKLQKSIVMIIQE